MQPAGTHQFIHALQVIRQVNDDMPVQHLLCLLVIAQEEAAQRDLTVTRLASAAGMTLASASRAVAQLSSLTRQASPGPALVEAHTNWANRREKHLRLTRAGARLVERTLEALNGPHHGPGHAPVELLRDAAA